MVNICGSPGGGGAGGDIFSSVQLAINTQHTTEISGRPGGGGSVFVRCQSLSSAAAAAISTDDDWHAGVGGGGGTGITTKVSGQIFEFVRWPSVCVCFCLLVCFTVCLCSPRCVLQLLLTFPGKCGLFSFTTTTHTHSLQKRSF